MLLQCDDSVCVASGRRPDGTQGPWRWYEFTTSGTPTGGTCTITPTDGEYLLTRFTIVCNGYSDPHGVQYADFYVAPGESTGEYWSYGCVGHHGKRGHYCTGLGQLERGGGDASQAGSLHAAQP